jgi:hypothetical protein
VSKGQETFFSYLSSGNLGYFVVESDTGYVTAGLGANALFDNFYKFHEVELDGSVSGDWDFEIDSAFSTDPHKKTFSISSHSGIHAAGQLVDNDITNYGSYFRFTNNFKDTLRTLAPIRIGSTTTFRVGKELSPDSLLILGTYQTILYQTEVLILCMDTLGNIHWQNNLAVQGQDLFPVDVHPTQDGGFLITTLEHRGLGGSGTDDEIHSIIYKTDSLGNIQAQRKPGNHQEYWTEPGGSLPLPDGSFISFWTEQRIIGNGVDQLNPIRTLYYALYSESGVLLEEGDYLEWIESESIGFQAYRYVIHHLQLLDDGNILLSGDNLREAFIMKVSPNGEYIWHRTYSPVGDIPSDLGFSQCRFYGVYPSSDGGFLCTGEFRSDDSPLYPGGYQSSILVKLDEYGCLEPGCHLVDALPEYETGSLRIFPNPLSGGELNIHFPQEVRVERVMLVDSQGRVIPDSKFKARAELGRSIQGPYSDHLESLILNLESLAPGLYTLIITTHDGLLFSEKVVVE